MQFFDKMDGLVSCTFRGFPDISTGVYLEVAHDANARKAAGSVGLEVMLAVTRASEWQLVPGSHKARPGDLFLATR